MILPDGYVHHPPDSEDDRGCKVQRLPPPKQRVPHLFGSATRLPPNLALKRHEQTERTCAVCGAVKVTVHHPDGRARREWRVPGADRQFEDDRTPLCVVAAP